LRAKIKEQKHRREDEQTPNIFHAAWTGALCVSPEPSNYQGKAIGSETTNISTCQSTNKFTSNPINTAKDASN